MIGPPRGLVGAVGPESDNGDYVPQGAVVPIARVAGQPDFAREAFLETVEDDARAAHADATSGELVVGDGPYAPEEQRVGGLTVIDVPDDATAPIQMGR